MFASCNLVLRFEVIPYFNTQVKMEHFQVNNLIKADPIDWELRVL